MQQHGIVQGGHQQQTGGHRKHRGLRQRLHLNAGTMDTLKTVTGVTALEQGVRGLATRSDKVPACTSVQVAPRTLSST